MSKTQWFKAKAPVSKAVSIVSHGLNLHPDRLQALIELLQEMGVDVLRLALTGHEKGGMKAFQGVTREQWLQDARIAYQEARRKADETGIPLFFLGYSLSAVLFQDLMNTETVRIDRQVLLSPALDLRKASGILRMFQAFGDRMILPSLTYANYHAHWGTPVAAYRALFGSVDQVRKTKLARSRIPTLVIIDPKDELVSYKRVRALIGEFDLKSWNILAIRASGDLPIQYHHLIVDPHSVGQEEWSRMAAAITQFFGAAIT